MTLISASVFDLRLLASLHYGFQLTSAFAAFARIFTFRDHYVDHFAVCFGISRLPLYHTLSIVRELHNQLVSRVTIVMNNEHAE